MFKQIAGYTVKLNNDNLIVGIVTSQGLKSAYKWDKNYNCWNNVFPVKINTFKSGIYSGRYKIK